MPVFRGTRKLSEAVRLDYADRLAAELLGKTRTEGLSIFEMPIGTTEDIEVLVVWDEWQSVRPEFRSSIILDAYDLAFKPVNPDGPPGSARAAIALGVSWEESLSQDLLPYGVVPVTREAEADRSRVQQAMLDEGAVRLNGQWKLLFPTRSLAEEARDRMIQQLPEGHWGLVQSHQIP